ncbi:HET-domain-containing protein [Zopfia rhizophila CBS 207.26]|uniref:HET-domain-containing protein n=1 Tax=Zopfia rhizophila CBS 207.26 TaxID=1314779 RepID=A0A6A6DZM9_9PEZI|nr:HET-domain-containing protein [Zopfia rhizophila CBS 207.26]
MTRLLLERGADFHTKDKTGRTPLDVACDKRHQGPFWALIEFGAGHATALHPGNLPEWVFTSDALIREPERLISALEILIMRNSALIEHKDPGYCVDCENLRMENSQAFQQKNDNVARWRGNRSFDTPFLKRCLLCRSVIATLGQSDDDSLLTNLSNLQLEREENTKNFATLEPVVTTYEDISGRKGVAWQPTITEELLPLLDHIEPWEDSDTGSKPAFAIAAYWFHKCLTQHPGCADGDRISKLPSRVLDVGNGQDQTVRLYVSGENERGVYCTLSYRWHAHTSFTTARSNIEQLRSKIPVDQLPKTIQDAITITRMLGVRYLWVDAIAIIQDEPEDWTREASKMDSIYRNSILTIAAVDEPNEDDGIFRRRQYNPRPYRRKQYPDMKPGYFDYNHPFVYFSKRARARPSGELDTRGWCLQEQLLSPRILSYADSELFWDCATTHASESWPGGISTSVKRFEQVKTGLSVEDLQMLKSFVARHNGKGQEFTKEEKRLAYELWRKAVEEFTNRSLTQETDRLIAIKGLASLVGGWVHDNAVSGVWKNDLARHLLWWVHTIRHPDLRLKRPVVFRAPSWSWASVVGTIDYRHIGPYRSPDDDMHDLGSKGGPFQSLITLLDMREDAITVKAYMVKAYTRDKENGKCLYYSGWRDIKYSGWRVFLSPGPLPERNDPKFDAEELTDSKGDEFDGLPCVYVNWLSQRRLPPQRRTTDCWEPWFPDTDDDFPSEMFCLLVGIENNNQLCLGLVPTEQGDSEHPSYRRIGVCSWYLGHADIGGTGLGTLTTATIV